MKNSLDGLNNWIERREKRTNKPEDRVTEITQFEQQRGKKKKKLKKYRNKQSYREAVTKNLMFMWSEFQRSGEEI